MPANVRRSVCRWIERAVLLLACGGALAGPVAPAPGELWLASGDTLTRLKMSGERVRTPLAADLVTPLGSSWKLLVYAYLNSRDIRPPAYRCDGHSAEEVFCCTPGNSIDAEQALAQSCGLYFEPRRLGITASDWQRFWRREAPHLPWLARLDAMRPATEVPVGQLLAALEAMPAPAAHDARAALMAVTLDGRGAGAVRYLGAGLRAKTWTWDLPRRPQEKMGGFAGWLADNRPVWAATYGASTSLYRDWSQRLAPLLERPPAPERGDCVQVRFFADYPLRDVRDANGRSVPAGPLQGAYQVQFQRGTTLEVVSGGELQLQRRGPRLWIEGRLGLEDYVARVVEREAALEPVAAARALAVAARSHVVQNAVHRDGCYVVDDSTRQQRVLARPPSARALQSVLWTRDLIVGGVPVRYHRDKAAPGLLGWTAAVRQAQQGADYVDILQTAFAKGRLMSLYAPDASQCQPLPQVQRWLAGQVDGWSRQMQEEEGFEWPELPEVCRLTGGRPQVDLQRRRVWVAGVMGQENRISLAHEWLHLAFAWHPRGRDEVYIESQARRLNGLAATEWK